MREVIFKRKEREKFLLKRKTMTPEKGKPEMEEVMTHENFADFEGMTTDFEGKQMKLNPPIVSGFYDSRGPKMQILDQSEVEQPLNREPNSSTSFAKKWSQFNKRKDKLV
jgi:hypothetical protein